MTLKEFFGNYTDENIMIAFSGGVDSSLLLKAACDAMDTKKNHVYAVTVSTTLHPGGEVELCRRVAEEIGAIHKVIVIDELRDAGILHNPVDRCYRCKKHLFTQVLALAEKLDCPYVFDGTNQDDLSVYRPGIQAVQELGIISPLAKLHLTKEQVRSLAEDYQVSVAARPSSPCLATRFPYGMQLTRENMEMVDKGERFLRNLGFYNVRVRMYTDPSNLATARIEIDTKEMPQVMPHSQELVDFFKSIGFSYVTLDMEGFRSGSMDIGIAP